MATTLIKAGEAAKDALTKGIIETILKNSPILQELPFITIQGNTLTYWQEKIIGSLAAWYAAGGTWTPVSPDAEEKTATLKILGGDVDFDQYTIRTRPTPDDYQASLVELKAKAVRMAFEDQFINGDGSSNKPEGLFKQLRGTVWAASTAYTLGQVVVPTTGKENGAKYICTTAGTSHATTEPTWPTTEGATVTDNTVVWTCYQGHHLGSGTNGNPLTLAILDQLIDLVKGGNPQMILMSPRSRRDLNKLIRASGALMETKAGKFGEFIQVYNGIPIGVCEWIKDNNTVGSSTDCSLIFAVQYGENAVAGISSPEMVQVETIGTLETKDANRIRIKWYVGMAVMSLPRAAVLSGVRPVV